MTDQPATAEAANPAFPAAAGPLTRRRELLEEGFSRAALARERLAGRMTTLRRGVYMPTAAFYQLGLEVRHAARAKAVAIAAPGLVISHISAAALHQLPVRPTGLGRVHATRIKVSGGMSDDQRVVHVGRLLADDIVEIEGARTTSLARTLVDLARTDSFEAGVIAADSAFHSHPEIVSLIPDPLQRSQRHQGHNMARRALLFADGRSESVGETRLRVLLHDIGLATPELQCRIVDDEGQFLGRVDMADLPSGTLMEFDGMAKYGKSMNPHRTELEVLRVEKKREESLHKAGWQVFRVVWGDLADPRALEKRIKAAFARSRRAIAVNPVAGSVQLPSPIQGPR